MNAFKTIDFDLQHQSHERMMKLMDQGAIARPADWNDSGADVYGPSADASPRLALLEGGAVYERSAYGADRRLRWPVLVGIVVAHIAVIVILLTVHYEVQRRDRVDQITTFSISEPLPAAPPQPDPEPVSEAQPVTTPQIVPEPRIQLDRNRETLAISDVSAAPVDMPIMHVAVDAPTMAAKSPPAPVPVTPPDFSAAQLDNPGPSYPYLSRKAKEEGVVVLRVLVSAEGRAKSLRIEETSGFDRLDKAALKTVKKWRFVPASQAGNPREAWVLVPITFSLG